jgi:hypothetical protein
MEFVMKTKNQINLVDLKLEHGLPEENLFKAWKNEPLTKKLSGTNIPFALPLPDASMSIVAKYKGRTIGQCSTSKTLTYWSHLDTLDVTRENKSTQTFVKIHQKAVTDEKKYLKEIEESEPQSLHSSGIAVLPKFRGNNLGFLMRKQQIKLCKYEQQATTLFCETTNSFSASTVKMANFYKIAEYPYKDLAIELEHPELAEIHDDSFSVWCLKL